MLAELWILLEQLNDYLIAPLLISVARVLTLIVSNVILYTSIHDYIRDDYSFPLMAYFFGLFHLILFHSVDLAKFAAATSIAFGMFFHLAAFISKILLYSTLENVIKYFVFVYALFWFYTDRDDIDEFVLVFIIMTVKLLCVADDLGKKTIDELERGYGLPGIQFEVMSYITYTAWISFKDFKVLTEKCREKNERWWNMLISAGSRAILYKIMSHKFLPSEVLGDIWQCDAILLLIHVFQFRCKYYYIAQIAELEAIAAGVKRGGWNKHCMFDFYRAESSITIKEFFSAVNLPLSTYVRNKFTTKHREGQIKVYVHLACFVILVASYSHYFIVPLFWFMVSVYTQKSAVLTIMSSCDTCLISCKKICRHRFGRKNKLFYILKFCFLIINQYRLALIFHNINNISYEKSFKYTITCAIIDVLTIIILVTRIPARHPIFAKRGHAKR